MSVPITLYYGSILVGLVHDAFLSDDTWFGQFEALPRSGGDETGLRVGEFISFSRIWNERLKNGEDVEASEFDAFDDLLTSGLWFAVLEDNVRVEIAEAPLFVDDEITWRPRATPRDRS